MHRSALIVAFSLSLAGCLRDASPPWVGSCADYPEGIYEYGQIGIGTCLSTPADLRFLERDGDAYLAVSNANAFRNFSSGSVSFFDWSSVDLTQETNLTGDLVAHAVELPHFPGIMAEIGERGLLAVPVRYSEDSNTRESFDDLHFLDVSEPLGTSAAAVGEDGATSLQVESDPFPTAYFEDQGYLFVGNRTSHTVSVVDVLASPMEIVDAETRARIGGERWFDSDGSGSKAVFSTLEIYDSDELVSETWNLEYVEGSYQVWLPDGEALQRYSSGGDGNWTESAFGVELDPDGSDGEIARVSGPFFYYSSSLGARMLFSSGGDIRGASPGDFLADWFFDEDTLLTAEQDSWDAELGNPSALRESGVTWLFYDGTLDGVSAIGVASSFSGYESFSRQGDGAILEAGGEHDAHSQRDPLVLWDGTLEAWRMYYSAWDGERWTIGHASSDELDSGWVADEGPVFEFAQGDAAVPRVYAGFSGFEMWYSRRGTTGKWRIGKAESVDGTTWTDLGVQLDYPGGTGFRQENPPGLATYIEETQAFDIEGLNVGPTLLHLQAGDTVDSQLYGFELRVAAGQQLDTSDVGDDAVNGVGVSSYVPDLGLAYLDLVNDEGLPSIGLAAWDGQQLEAREGAIFEAGAAGAFDEDGVSSPVVFQDDDGSWTMLYAGHGDGLARIGRATSDDGVSWTRDSSSPVFELGDSWDVYGAWPGSIERTDEGDWRLWYSGSDGDRRRIGIATSTDGVNFEQAREDGGWLFGTGSPGDWDDTSVYDPWVVDLSGTLHLFYVGFDGEDPRIGHARTDTDVDDLERDEDDDENAIYLIEGQAGGFDDGGVERPVAFQSDTGWNLFYQGQDSGVVRPGLAMGPDPTVLYKAPRSLTSGDLLTFTTQAGQSGTNPIDLDDETDGYTTTGRGLAALYLDQDAGLLYVGSKLVSYIQVFDVRDDSVSGFDDSNYMAVEAILTTDTASGGVGFRGMVASSDGTKLYALNDSPEGVFVFDISSIEDDGWGDVVYDAQVGWLPASRGSERDQGAATVVSAGPTGIALMPDGQTLLVTNFNDNSLGVYDLRMGAYGQLVGEVSFFGENPHTVIVTPDGRHAVVACYAGEVDENNIASTLAVIDVDPDSETWLEVLTWIVNQ